MSVLIKGMKMPEDCPMCPLAHWTKVTDEFTGCDIVGGKKYAIIKDKEYANSSTRPDWCPLVELPDKHGRLIDADALMDIFADRLAKVSERYGIDSAVASAVSGAMKLLDVQPTVIDVED